MLHAAEMAAAEMQLLRQALDKLQAETHVLDDELAQAREQSILGELERAELSHELEAMSAKLQASESSRAELEGTISKVNLTSRVKCVFLSIKHTLMRHQAVKSWELLVFLINQAPCGSKDCIST